jgi:hypothetical protein
MKLNIVKRAMFFAMNFKTHSTVSVGTGESILSTNRTNVATRIYHEMAANVSSTETGY